MAMRRGLKEVLRSRLGHFVPSETRFLVDRNWSLASGGLQFALVQPPNSGDAKAVEAAKEVKQFMRETFYPEAVIPKALGLTSQREDISKMVDKELELYANSGMSIVFRNAETGTILGGQLICSWSRNHDYEIVEEASMASWLNTAAEIAMEVCPESPQAIWRDYQYQHQYNLAQKRIRDTGANFCAYMGIAYLHPDARGTGVHKVVAAPFLRALLAGNGTMLDLCTTDSLMENSVGAVFNGTAIVIDSMPYKEQILSVGGSPVFGHLVKFGSIHIVSLKRNNE